MADQVINAFTKGIYNLADAENIPTDAASDSKNWITADGRIVLAGGRKIVGADGTIGKIYGLHYGYKNDGTKVMYRKAGTKIQYLSGTTWTDIITGLTETADYTFSNYTSHAGDFTYATGVDGIYKIHNANPGSYTSMYDATKNSKGKSFITGNRMHMWDCADLSKTVYRQSYIETEKNTTVTDEVISATTGQQTYTGTLAFKAGGAVRTCFATQFYGTVVAGVETFVDGRNGTLLSNYGGTGTINYTSGVYSITFSANTTVGPKCTYQWENSNDTGITDFTYGSPRNSAEGNIFTIDQGGDPIQSVSIGQDGAFYILKTSSAHKIYYPDTTDADNPVLEVYRNDLGLPFFRAVVSTSKGILFMNTSNSLKPELTILEKNQFGDNIEPKVLAPQFKFEDYIYTDACIDTWERFVIIACKTQEAIVNDTILLFNMSLNTVDVTSYPARMFAKDSGNLYVGSPITTTVHQIFDGYDDLELPVQNYWIGKADGYEVDRLKKIRRLRFSGRIDPDQSVEVWLNYDSAGWQQAGTIVGSGTYVDYSAPFTVGSTPIGEQQTGGDDADSVAYSFQMEIKLKPPKFRVREVKFIAAGIGYVDIDGMTDWDILLFENRIPKRYRSKQNVSMDGLTTNN